MVADKLFDMLCYARNNTHYYGNLHMENERNIEEYPRLFRWQIQKNPYDFLAIKYKGNVEDLLIKTSSGSTGCPVSVFWSQNDYLRSMYCLWKLRRRYYNITPRDLYIDFLLNETEKRQWYSFNGNRISVSMKVLDDIERLETLLRMATTMNVSWIYIQPYIANKLAEQIIEYGLSVPKTIRYIEFVGEVLPDQVRRLIEAIFMCPTANMYGSEEMNAIAYECPYHHMHILENNCLVETPYLDGGEIMITNLCNFTMPLIKYVQGDIVEKTFMPICQCGVSSDVILHICGRTSESIVIGKVNVNTYFLVNIMEDINKHYARCIKGYGFVFERRHDCLSLNIRCDVVEHGRKEMIMDSIVSAFHEHSIVINKSNIKMESMRDCGHIKQKILEIR